MGGGGTTGGGPGGGGGGGGGSGPIDGLLGTILGSSPARRTASPNWNRLRWPPSSFTFCTLANNSRCRVGSTVRGSICSSLRLERNEGRNSSPRERLDAP